MATEQTSRTRESTYTDNAMTWLLGTHAKARMLTVFVGKAERDLSAREVSDLAGIHPSTFNEHVGDLLDLGVVVETRQSGNAQLYQLNPDSDVADTLRQLQFDLVKAVADIDASADTESSGDADADGSADADAEMDDAAETGDTDAETENTDAETEA